MVIFKNVSAQHPAYFILGENQFRGIQIYDVIQDKALNYWFATNDGIYYFDYHTYEKIECDKDKSNSVFNFVKNNDGTIYCHNLNNQVFEIKNKTCNLFYELMKEESSSDISLAISDDGDLVVGARKIIVLNNNGIVVSKFNFSNCYLGQAFTDKDKKLHYHFGSMDSVLVYSHKTFSKHKLNLSNDRLQSNAVLKFFKINNQNYALDLFNKVLYKYQPYTFELESLPNNNLFGRSGSVRIYEVGNDIWVAGTLPGVFYIKDNLVENNYGINYNDYFISDIFKDTEGNILLSTFDKGVIVVPDLKTPDVINTFHNDPIVSLYSDNKLGLLLGSSKGKLMNFNNKKIVDINTNGKRPIEAIYGSLNSNLILFDDGYIRGYNKLTGDIYNIALGSLKDAVFFSDRDFYLGTNLGILKCHWENGNNFIIESIPNLNYRMYDLEYNSNSKCLYASTSNGMYIIDSIGRSRKIEYLGESIYPTSLSFNDDKIYACDKKNGILVINQNKVTSVIKPIVFEKQLVLNKIIIHNNSIIANSSNGFYQFDLNGKVLKSLHTVFGFNSKRVIDFTFHQNNLWISHSEGVQQIHLNSNQFNGSKQTIRINKIIVNDIENTHLEKNNFNSEQRKIQFSLTFPTIRNRETIRYHYKLVGYDSNWNINTEDANQIIYNSLASGSYTFQVKAENQGVFSDVASYSFSIDYPFYFRWWFILIVIVLFIAVVFFIYRWRLSIQQKKMQQINELNASKLTAIQSQMNPHFIFNSLNSIQDLVLKGDVENSYSYITTFSNLVRRTLSYSEKDFIDFEQEIKLLEIYLSLEKLRFKKDFEYEIVYNDVDDIMLPPLLIQPFIENSLLHGLLHKEGEKRLKISFSLKDVLICVIEDNGVGREKSKAIKLRQKSEHESFSGKAIHKRFEILSDVFEGNFGYVYEDLYNNDEAIGTKVTLSIPVKHKF